MSLGGVSETDSFFDSARYATIVLEQSMNAAEAATSHLVKARRGIISYSIPKINRHCFIQRGFSYSIG